MISDPLTTAVISKINTSASLAWRRKDVTEGVFYGADDPVERRDPTHPSQNSGCHIQLSAGSQISGYRGRKLTFICTNDFLGNISRSVAAIESFRFGGFSGLRRFDVSAKLQHFSPLC